jgi:hypothetical protein
MRFHMIRDSVDETASVTLGFLDGTLEDLQRTQVEHGFGERRRA